MIRKIVLKAAAAVVKGGGGGRQSRPLFYSLFPFLFLLHCVIFYFSFDSFSRKEQFITLLQFKLAKKGWEFTSCTVSLLLSFIHYKLFLLALFMLSIH